MNWKSGKEPFPAPPGGCPGLMFQNFVMAITPLEFPDLQCFHL